MNFTLFAVLFASNRIQETKNIFLEMLGNKQKESFFKYNLLRIKRYKNFISIFKKLLYISICVYYVMTKKLKN